jgi:trimeric autotransporter adhesin
LRAKIRLSPVIAPALRAASIWTVSALAKSSALAPCPSWVASWLEAPKLNVSFASGLAVPKSATMSWNTSVSDEAANTTISPETGPAADGLAGAAAPAAGAALGEADGLAAAAAAEGEATALAAAIGAGETAGLAAAAAAAEGEATVAGDAAAGALLGAAAAGATVGGGAGATVGGGAVAGLQAAAKSSATLAKNTRSVTDIRAPLMDGA